MRTYLFGTARILIFTQLCLLLYLQVNRYTFYIWLSPYHSLPFSVCLVFLCVTVCTPRSGLPKPFHLLLLLSSGEDNATYMHMNPLWPGEGGRAPFIQWHKFWHVSPMMEGFSDFFSSRFCIALSTGVCFSVVLKQDYLLAGCFLKLFSVHHQLILFFPFKSYVTISSEQFSLWVL